MKHDASLLILFAALAILSAAFSPSESAQAEPTPVEEIRIGNVAEVAEIDEVKDVKAANGWYKKTRGGWMFWPEGTVDESKPPKAELAAFMGSELAQSIAGMLVLLIPFVLVIFAKRRGARRKNAKELKRVGGASDAEFQALKGQVALLAAAMQSVMPENAGIEKGRGKR